MTIPGAICLGAALIFVAGCEDGADTLTSSGEAPGVAVEGAPSAAGDPSQPAEPRRDEQAMYSQTPAEGEELPTSMTTPGPVPLPYRAVWAIEPGDCTASPGLTRIAIAPGAVRFYEGRSEIIGTEVRPDGVLVMQVTHTAEGETATEQHELSLDASASQLTYRRGEFTFLYTRCPL